MRSQGSTMNIEIRRIRGTTEAGICARLMANCEPWITLQRDYAASLQTISAASKEVYIALIAGEIVGFIILNMHGAFVGYIQSICTSPQWRGRGIGSQLIAYAEKRIFREVPNAFICVSSFNESARRLYERLGYVVIGELKDFIISGYSELLMRKTIAPLAEFKPQIQENIRISQERRPNDRNEIQPSRD